MRYMIIFSWILCAALIAFAVIYYNRRQMQTKQTIKREPLLNDSYADQEEIYDPVVGSSVGAVSTPVVTSKITTKTNENFRQVDVTPSDATAAPVEKTEKPSSLANQQCASELFPNGILSLMVMAKEERPYAGYELLQALLSSGLRYGKMNIFHRYQSIQINGANEYTNQVLYSLASAVKPGTFEMPKMGAFSTPGLVLFMQVSSQPDVLSSFELMLETARQLTEDLGGEIWNAHRQIANEENLNDIRNRLSEYERSLTTADLFKS